MSYKYEAPGDPRVELVVTQWLTSGYGVIWKVKLQSRIGIEVSQIF